MEGNEPVDWFPGVHTGPRMAITITPDEIDVLRRTIEDHSYPGDKFAAVLILQDLQVRVGAVRQLDADHVRVPLLFNEFEQLRLFLREYERYRDKRQLAPVRQLFTELHQRLGAEQMRRAASGEMTAGEVGHDETFYDGQDVDLATELRSQRNLRPRFGFGGSRWDRRHP